jgi:hypothetical protein
VNIPVLTTTFFAAAIEVIEMVAIVVGSAAPDPGVRRWPAPVGVWSCSPC